MLGKNQAPRSLLSDVEYVQAQLDMLASNPEALGNWKIERMKALEDRAEVCFHLRFLLAMPLSKLVARYPSHEVS
jgi:hypothetical protein